MMKVLFLDIDGVLNSVRSAVALYRYPHPGHPKDWDRFDEIAVKLIIKVCKDTGTRIVLSSTWRKFKGWELLKPLMGLDIIDVTPQKLSARRGEEIAMWLRDHPEVTKYAIVDDDRDMLEEQLPYFVKTENMEGLSYKNYEKLKELLEDKQNIA